MLIGEKINYLGRAADMLDFGFGDDVPVTDMYEEMRMASRFVLHIQTPWRLTKHDKIILGSYEFYVPKEEITPKEFEAEKFDNSMLDTITNELNPLLKQKPSRFRKSAQMIWAI